MGKWKGAFEKGFFLFLLPVFLMAQPNEVMSRIEQSIRMGSADMLKPLLANRVEIVIPENSGDYGKNQAYFILKEFFASYPVRSFTFVHRGQSGNTFYAVGTYVSTRGNFDANVFLRHENGNYTIEQIRFEPSQ
jgi:hypothetical protein